MRTDQCKACKANIYWCRTPAGKMAPIDAEPSPDGNVSIRDGVAVVLKADERGLFDGPLHKNHFATCSHAKQFQKPKGEQRKDTPA
jgi:hypothetical protein